MTATFNLVTQPCVPVRTLNGHSDLVSLQDCLVNAPHLAGIDTGRPLLVLPLTRLLTAIVMDIFPSARGKNIETFVGKGKFDESTIRSYFEQHCDRFDLFHPEHPFYQVKNIQQANGVPKQSAVLDITRPSGNNVPLFGVFTDADVVPLTPAQAFSELLTFQGYDTASIKPGVAGDPQVKTGKTTGNPTGLLGYLGGVIPLGKNLFHTLLLNIPDLFSPENDLPLWLRDETAVWSVREPKGILELLTWSSRRVRLIPDDDGMVRSVVMGAGDRVPFVPQIEPHCRWKDDPKAKIARRPIRWQPGQPAWRGLPSLLALHNASGEHTSNLLSQLEHQGWLPVDYPLLVCCVGVKYGTQSAVVEDVFFDQMPIPMAAMYANDEDGVRAGLTEVVLRAEKVRRALNELSDNLRRAQGVEAMDWDKGLHPGNSLLPQLSEPTYRLLRGLQQDPEKLEQGILAWEQTVEKLVWQVANPLLNEVSPSAFKGREVKRKPLRLANVEAFFKKALRDALPDIIHGRNKERKEQL